jgi:uncharacterized protein YjbJ (UPF0337 family)
MSITSKDELEGKFEKAKGFVKDKVGEATGDRELEAEGEVQRAEGEAQETWGEVKRNVSDAAESVKDAVKKATT